MLLELLVFQHFQYKAMQSELDVFEIELILKALPLRLLFFHLLRLVSAISLFKMINYFL
jgi:hypothetical protein